MRQLRQRVGLVHELTELVGPEERVNDARQGLRINQVHRRKHLVIPHIHPLPNGPRHPRKPDAELIGQLLPDSPHPPVTQVVDIVDIGLRVNQLDQVLDNGDHILARQHLDLARNIQIQFLINPEPPHIPQVIPLVREEELVDHIPCRSLIRRLGVAQLAVDIHHRFLLRVTRVFLQRIVNDRVITGRSLFLMQQQGLLPRLQDLVDMLLAQNRLAVDDNLVPLDGNHLAGILVHKVLGPRLQNPRRQFPPHGLLQIGLVDLDLIGQVENLQDLPIALEADRPQQRSHRQLLLPVDIRIHHVIDIRRELDPRTLERNNPRTVQLGPVRVHALAEENPRRPVQLRHNDPFRPIDDERPPRRHIRNGSEIDILHHRIEILVFRVRTVQLQFGLQRHAIGQTALQTLVDRVSRRVDIVVDELQHEVIPRIIDREVLHEDFVQALIESILRGSLKLEKVFERFELHLQKVRIVHPEVRRGEADPLRLPTGNACSRGRCFGIRWHVSLYVMNKLRVCVFSLVKALKESGTVFWPGRPGKGTECFMYVRL